MSRPLGFVGLFASLFAIVALGLVYCLTAIGAAALLDLAILGRSQLAGTIAHLREMVFSGDADGFLSVAFGLGLLVYLGVLAAILTLAAWRGGRDWRGLIGWTRWSPLRAGRAYWGLVAGGLIYGVVASIAFGIAYPEAKQWAQFPHSRLGVLLTILLAVAVGPLVEEVVFRGWIFTNLRARLSFWPANLISAAAFAIAHWEHTHLYAVAIFPLGLMLGLAREEAGSTQASATFHAIYNASVLAIALLGPS